jgi:predicted DNA-binding protein (UPF0251 family)
MSDLLDLLRRLEFLGEEFLTYLYVHSFLDDGGITLGDGRKIEVVAERMVALQGAQGKSDSTVVRSEELSESEEARIALKIGKKVTSGQFLFAIQGEDYKVVLDKDLCIRSVALPALETFEPFEQEVEVFEKIGLVEDAIESLFLDFLEKRMDQSRWSKEMDDITAWLKSGVEERR